MKVIEIVISQGALKKAEVVFDEGAVIKKAYAPSGTTIPYFVFELIRQKTKFDLGNEFYVNNFGANCFNYTAVSMPENFNTNDEFYYMFFPNGYEVHNVYHENIKYLFDGSLNNKLPGHVLLGNYKSLNLNDLNAIVFKAQNDLPSQSKDVISGDKYSEIIEIFIGKNAINFMSSSQDYIVNKDENRYFNYFFSVYDENKRSVVFKFKVSLINASVLTGMNKKQKIETCLISHLLDYINNKDVSFSFFEGLNIKFKDTQADSFSSLPDNLEEVIRKSLMIKSEEELNIIMGNFLNLSRVVSPELSVKVLLTKSNLTERKSALNVMFAGAQKEVLIHFVEKNITEQLYDVYCGIVEDTFFDLNNYNKFLGDGTNNTLKVFENMPVKSEINFMEIVDNCLTTLSKNYEISAILTNKINLYHNQATLSFLNLNSVSPNGVVIKDIKQLKAEDYSYKNIFNLANDSTIIVEANPLPITGFDGKLFSKTGQVNIPYNESSAVSNASLKIDLTKAGISPTGLTDVKDSLNNFEIVVNGISNEYFLTIDDSKTEFVARKQDEKYFDVVIADNAMNLVWKNKTILMNGGLNKVAVVFKNKTTVAYYEEFYFNKVTKDIVVESVTTDVTSTTIYKDNLNIDIQIKGDKDIAESVEDNYEIFVKNKTNRYSLGKLNTVNQRYNKNFSFSSDIFKHGFSNVTSNEMFDTNWTVEIDRIFTTGVKNIYTTVAESPSIKKEEFSLYLLNKDYKRLGVPEYTDGFIVLETNCLNVKKDLFPYIKTIEVGATEKLNEVLNNGFDYNQLAVFQEIVYGDSINPTKLIFEIKGMATQPSAKILNFTNTNIVQNMTLKLTFHGGAILEFKTIEKIGELFTLAAPIFKSSVSPNKDNVIDYENPDIMVFYDESVQFKIDNIDPKARFYETFQDDNSIFKERPLIADTFSYTVAESDIDYDKLGTNTKPIKFTTKIFLETESGQTTRQSQAAEIPAIIRKRPSIPVFRNTQAVNSIYVNKDTLKIADAVNLFDVLFDDGKSRYSNKRIYKLTGSFLDTNQKELKYETQIKRNATAAWETVNFFAAFEQEEGISTQIFTNNKVSLDLMSLPSVKIMTITNQVIDTSEIYSIKDEAVGVKAISMKKILDAYTLLNKGFLEAKELQVVLKTNSYDKTLKPENIEYLNNLGLSQARIDEVKAICTSEPNFLYLDIVKLSDLGVNIYPVENVFEQLDTDEKNLESLKTFYTYSDNSKFKIVVGSRNDDTQVIQVKFPGNTIFSDVNSTKKMISGSEYLEATFDVTLFQNEESTLQIREKSESRVGEPIPIKVVKINKDKITPQIKYASVQDATNNLKDYNTNNIIFELLSNRNIKKYVYYFSNKGLIVGEKKEINSIDGNLLLTCPANIPGDYKLEIFPYDLSGRLIKKFEYVVGYVTTSLNPVNLKVENYSEMNLDKYVVNDTSIAISFDNQSKDQISKYKIIINNTQERYISQSYGKNLFSFSHLGGVKIPAGEYTIEVIPINILGNETGSEKISINYANLPKTIKTNMKTFTGNNVNNLNCEIISYDSENTESFEYILGYTNKRGEAVVITLNSKNKKLEFLKDGEYIEDDIAPDSLANLKVYCKNANGFIDVGLYAEHSFKFRKEEVSISETDVQYLSFTKDSKPVFLVKQKSNLVSVEIKNSTKNESYSAVKESIYIGNPVSEGEYRYSIKFTDIYGNITETFRDMNVSFADDGGLHAIIDETIINTNRESFDIRPYFNLNFKEVNQDYIRYGSTFGAEGFVRTSDIANIPIPFDLKDGIYYIKFYAFNSKTSLYDYLIKEIKIHFIKNVFKGPKVINSPYSAEEISNAYTSLNEVVLSFALDNDILKYIGKVKIDYSVFEIDTEEQVESKSALLEKTDVSFKVPFTFQENKNYTCYFEIKTIGLNEKESETSYFTFYVLRKLPKPLSFVTSPDINLKYDNRKDGKISFKFKDTNESYQKITGVKFNLNGSRETSKLNLGTDVPITDDGYYTYEIRSAVEQGPFKLTAIGYDKAGNQTTNDPEVALSLDLIDFPNGDNKYLFFEKVIDTVKPVVLNDNTVHIRENVNGIFNNINVYFDLPEKELCYLEFEVFTKNGDTKNILITGNSFPYHEDLMGIPMPSEFKSGIELKDNASGNKAYIRKNIASDYNSTGFENLHLSLEELNSGDLHIGLTIVDLSGNKSNEYVKPVKVIPPEIMTPTIVSPTYPYTNNSNVMFSWSLAAENIIKWQYQFVHLANNEKFSNLDNDWISLREPTFRYRVANGKDKDGEYGFRVRGVVRGTKTVNGEVVNVDTPTNFAEYRMFIDREIPEGIRFLNKVFTQDASFLSWDWEFVPDADGNRADGVYVTMNPNRPIEEWEKIESRTEYVSNVSRPDGVYTLYAKTFDKAGNVGERIFNSAIYIDTTAPRVIELNQINPLITNKIPTISWKNNLNISKRYWLVLKEEFAEDFLFDYEALNIKDRTEQYEYIWDKNFNMDKISEINSAVISFADKYQLSQKRNNFITTNEIKVCSENGIKEDGKYRFFIVGREESGLFTNGSENGNVPNTRVGISFVKIEYDTKAIELNGLEFLKPVYPIVEEKRPDIELRSPSETTKVVFSLKTNSTRETLLSETINTIDRMEGSYKIFKYKPSFNIPFGEYIIECNCYDEAGNSTVIDKMIIITSTDYNIFEDSVSVYVPEVNATLKIKQRRGSSTYVIESIDINSSSVLYYREVKENLDYEERWSMIEFNKTELSLNDKKYEFKLVGYTVKEI